MNPKQEAVIVGVLLVLICAVGGGFGVATLLLKPFGEAFSIFVGVVFIVSAITCWGWACFAREELFR